MQIAKDRNIQSEWTATHVHVMRTNFHSNAPMSIAYKSMKYAYSHHALASSRPHRFRPQNQGHYWQIIRRRRSHPQKGYNCAWNAHLTQPDRFCYTASHVDDLQFEFYARENTMSRNTKQTGRIVSNGVRFAPGFGNAFCIPFRFLCLFESRRRNAERTTRLVV